MSTYRLGASGLLVYFAAQPLHVLFVIRKICSKDCGGGLLLGCLRFTGCLLFPDGFAFQIAVAHLVGEVLAGGIDAL